MVVILCHALRDTRALRVLRTRGVARRRRLVTDWGELRVCRSLSRHADSLSHLTVDRSVGAVVVRSARVASTRTLVVGLAGSLLLLLLSLPLLSDLFEFYVVELATCNTCIKKSAKLVRQGSTVVSFRHLKLSVPAGTPSK